MPRHETCEQNNSAVLADTVSNEKPYFTKLFILFQRNVFLRKSFSELHFLRKHGIFKTWLGPSMKFSWNPAETLTGCLSVILSVRLWHLYQLDPSLSQLSDSVLISYGAGKELTGNQITTSQNEMSNQRPIFRTGKTCWMRWCFRLWHYQWSISWSLVILVISP